MQAHFSKLHNSQAVKPVHHLAPMPHPDTGIFPPELPARVEVLQNYNAAQCNALLQFYGQPTDGQIAVREKRISVADFIGCRAYVM
jgi:hypothetical protein